MAYLEDILPQVRKGRKARHEMYVYYIKDNELWYEEDGYEEPFRAAFDIHHLQATNWELVPEPKKIRAKINLWSNGAITTACCSEQITTRAKLIETRVIEWEVTE